MARMLQRKNSCSKEMKKKRVENDEKKKSFLLQKDSLSLQRTTTILEMICWQNEESNQHANVEISVGNEFSNNNNNDEHYEKEEEEVTLATKETTSTSIMNTPCREKRDDIHKNPVDAYMASREMTCTQERGNALTMIPSPLYCIYYIIAGKWLAHATLQGDNDSTSTPPLDSTDCIQSAWFPHSMPPLSVLFVALGIVIHAPFSFVYHWSYAPILPPGIARTDHVSRRLDQAMIHVASALLSYATSASWYYFWANAFYNADCFRRQFRKEINPRGNQIRIAISMVFYTGPILVTSISLFLECWAVIGVSAWLFVRYPLGGWSHSAFHLVIALLPPLVMEAACRVNPQAIRQAATCAAAMAAATKES
jgi:hypothetical protein